MAYYKNRSTAGKLLAGKIFGLGMTMLPLLHLAEAQSLLRLVEKIDEQRKQVEQRLAAALQELLTNENLRRSLAETGRGRLVALADPGRMVETYQNLYEQVLVGAQGRP